MTAMRLPLLGSLRLPRVRNPRKPARPRLEVMEDRLLLTTYQVTNTLDDGSPGSLRWAIGQTNGGPGGDSITFSIGSGTGVRTIAVTSALPAITVPVTIDATLGADYAG